MTMLTTRWLARCGRQPDCPSDSVWSSKWHVSFTSRCLGRRLSTWQMTVTSCPTALNALYGRLTFRLAWCQEHTAVAATELLQPLDLNCGTLFLSSCAIQTSATDCLDDSWRDISLVNHERGALWLLDIWRLRKTLTYLLTYLLLQLQSSGCYWPLISRQFFVKLLDWLCKITGTDKIRWHTEN